VSEIIFRDLRERPQWIFSREPPGIYRLALLAERGDIGRSAVVTDGPANDRGRSDMSWPDNWPQDWKQKPVSSRSQAARTQRDGSTRT